MGTCLMVLLSFLSLHQNDDLGWFLQNRRAETIFYTWASSKDEIHWILVSKKPIGNKKFWSKTGECKEANTTYNIFEQAKVLNE